MGLPAPCCECWTSWAVHPTLSWRAEMQVKLSYHHHPLDSRPLHHIPRKPDIESIKIRYSTSSARPLPSSRLRAITSTLTTIRCVRQTAVGKDIHCTRAANTCSRTTRPIPALPQCHARPASFEPWICDSASALAYHRFVHRIARADFAQNPPLPSVALYHSCLPCMEPAEPIPAAAL